MEAGAALAAAAAVRELVRQNDDEGLFQGCSSPEQGLDVAVFKDPKSGLYFVVLHQRFDRCGGPVGRVLDWWHEYAVTAQGEVLGEAPPSAWDESPPPAQGELRPSVPPPSSVSGASVESPPVRTSEQDASTPEPAVRPDSETGAR